MEEIWLFVVFGGFLAGLRREISSLNRLEAKDVLDLNSYRVVPTKKVFYSAPEYLPSNDIRFQKKSNNSMLQTQTLD